MGIGVWHVVGGAAARLTAHSGFLEKDFENWVESDPSLVMEGMRWVGRQMVLPDRSRLDLLGLTREGEWVVAELKPGPAEAAALHQALNYATHIATMPRDNLLRALRADLRSDEEVLRHVEVADEEQRRVSIAVVARSATQWLTQAVDFLEQRKLDLPIRLVSIEVVVFGDNILLAREVKEHTPPPPSKAEQGARLARVMALADEGGVLDIFKRFAELPDRLGYRLRVWPASLTLNPASDARKTLIYMQPRKNQVEVAYVKDTIAEEFGVDVEEVRAALGEESMRLSPGEASAFLDRCEGFLGHLAGEGRL